MAKPETPHRPATPPYPLPHRDHDHDPSSCSLEKFRLFETQARFYLIGCDRRRRFHRVLKIDRSERSDLHISEDPVVYTEQEVKNLLHRIAEGNRSTGGLTAGGTVYGIAGCIKFLESYYLILVTKRRQVGAICGHAIYSIEEIQMITVPHSSVQSDVAHCKVELRYKKLLSSVDLTKDFYYSYTYPIMQSLQMNMRSTDRGGMPYENMFVWNAYLTEAIRSKCGNTMWTIALIHGDFQQVRLSTYGREFIVTIIARRSRHFAGTRYLKRGVNDRGWVANDVETEQIVIDEQSGISEGKMSSVVQVRGSIPLFWSQEASRFSPKPDIILQRYDPTYQATKLHFEDLSRRYGNPIIVLNLIKTVEKRPREMILRREFASAVGYLNQILPKEKQLRFIHWDFHKFAKSKSANVLAVLGGVASEALDLTGLCYSGKPLPTKQRTTHQSQTGMRDSTVGDSKVDCVDPWKTVIDFKGIDAKSISEDNELLNKEVKGGRHRPQFQSGVLRTNCIDCLDRTNVAQYAYGLAALGCQLHAMGLTDTPKVDPDSSIATNLMDMYQSMGDALAHQYGGSAAHNTVFPERQGKWKATTQSREFIKSIRRYYSNTYTDGEKQDAINLFLGYFKPQEGKPALWELDSDYYLHVTNIGVEPVPDSWKSSSYMPSDSEETEITALVDSSFLELRNSLAPIPACKKDFTCLKLTSFEKLLNTTGGSVKNVRLCSESETKTGGIGGTSRMAPDAAEIQLKTPNWLYGQRKYEEIAVRKTMDTSEEATAQDHFYDDKYWNLGWLSRSDNEDEDIFKRYLMMASDDGDEIWFGGKLLFCQDESSEAYMHYAAFCQGHAMKPFQEDKEKEEHYRETLYMGHDCDADDALVKANMESALENCSHIGEDLGIGISCRSLAEDPCYLTRWIIGEERIQVKGG